jgi:hypothetical protein
LREVSLWRGPLRSGWIFVVLLFLSLAPASHAQSGAPLAPSTTQTSQTSGWNPQPWLDDLDQIRRALDVKYANWTWLTQTRQANIDALFADASSRIEASGSDAEARAVFDRLIRKIDDGHVTLDWPHAPSNHSTAPNSKPGVEIFCRSLGYAIKPDAINIAESLSGYKPLGTDPVLPEGIITVNGTRVGVLRIEVFMPEHSPTLCTEAVQQLHIDVAASCDDACSDKIDNFAYARMTAILEDRLRNLRSNGATVLMVDITNNGGGSEWSEAVARELNRKELLAEPLGFVRGPQWTKHWDDVIHELQTDVKEATPADQNNLQDWISQANRARQQAEVSCPHNDPHCDWLGRAGYATGLVGRAPANAFAGKPWGPTVFTPAEFPYHDGVWDGPVIILTDQGTFSAAEEFAATLQDNHVALIAGARTGGAGCGHTDGGTPTTLSHSHATLELPDCARFRVDGTNEVNGVTPDRLLPWRANDGPTYKAHLLEQVLPTMIDDATRIYTSTK